MSSSFFDRVDELKAEVGDRDLAGSVVVDQVYAAYQLFLAQRPGLPAS